jgi:hypothetical protein
MRSVVMARCAFVGAGLVSAFDVGALTGDGGGVHQLPPVARSTSFQSVSGWSGMVTSTLMPVVESLAAAAAWP